MTRKATGCEKVWAGPKTKKKNWQGEKKKPNEYKVNQETLIRCLLFCFSFALRNVRLGDAQPAGENERESGVLVRGETGELSELRGKTRVLVYNTHSPNVSLDIQQVFLDKRHQLGLDCVERRPILALVLPGVAHHLVHLVGHTVWCWAGMSECECICVSVSESVRVRVCVYESVRVCVCVCVYVMIATAMHTHPLGWRRRKPSFSLRGTSADSVSEYGVSP